MERTIQITHRDLQILREIAFSRFLTVGHIADLCFEGRREAAKKRVQKLVASGYLETKEIFCGIPEVKSLSKLGWQCLAKSFRPVPNFKVQAGTLKHDLLLRDCMCRAVAAARRFGVNSQIQLLPYLLKIQEWTNTRHLAPDGTWKVEVNGVEFRIFVELDRGTEKQKELAEKLHFYRDFMLSKRKPKHVLGVLFIFLHQKRMELFQSRYLQEPSNILISSVLMEPFLANPLGALSH